MKKLKKIMTILMVLLIMAEVDLTAVQASAFENKADYDITKIRNEMELFL